MNEFAEELQARTVQEPLVEARLSQSLASALAGLGDYRSARTRAERAASLFSKHLGPKHGSTLKARLLAARVLMLNQAPGIAAILLRHVIALDDPDRNDDSDWNLIQLTALMHLAETEIRKAKLEDVERSLKKAEEKVPLIEASAKDGVQDSLKNIRRQLLIAQGKWDEALPSAREDYENTRQRYGESDYRTAQAGDLLASIYTRQHRFDLAIELYEDSFRITRQLFGEDRQNTLLRVLRLANVHYHAKNYAAADSYFRMYDPLHSALRRYGGDHHYGNLRMWAVCLCKLGKFDEAESLLHRCHAYYAKGGSNEQSQKCIANRKHLVAILRDTGRDELADQWLVSPKTPSPIRPSDLRVGPSGEVTLDASKFRHFARDMKHHATRWQIRAAGDTFNYSPTLDVTTTEHLEQFVIPAGILLPNREYFWRVAHVGQNRVQSEFSDSSSFQTEDLEYQLKPIDLTRAFNRDVVHSPGDDSEDPFQPVTKQLLIDGYRPDDSSKEPFNGVPRDGIIGPHQLGDYQKPNSIQLDSKNDQADIVLPLLTSVPYGF